tara:strand:+ start:7321 stop:7602 length:282 start_codon:yes stop_codon:yes gene_type:complete
MAKFVMRPQLQDNPMNNIIFSGAVIALLGILGLAVPAFTTQSTEDIAQIGDLKIQTTEKSSHNISPYLSGGIVVLGLLVMGGGATQRNRRTNS